MRYQLNKLVRDNIPQAMEADGQVITGWQLDDIEYSEKLQQKLTEEVDEYAASPGPNELADMLEVIETLARHEHGMDFDALRALQLEIRNRSGGFEQRTYAEDVDVPEHSQWNDYYASSPDRFPPA